MTNLLKNKFIIGPALAVFGLLVFAMPAEAGSFFLSPSSTTVSNGSTFTVNLVVGTDGQAINSGQAAITYSTDKLDVVGVSGAGRSLLFGPENPLPPGGRLILRADCPRLATRAMVG
jgi:hypothetical protein